MFDLVIRSGPGTGSGIVIGAAHLQERFAHAGGPGGMSVNTADSRVQLSLDLLACDAFSEPQLQRIRARLSSRLVGSVVTVTAGEYRSQHRNRIAARTRLANLLFAALVPVPSRRQRHRPSRAQQERRLAAKRRRAVRKQERRSNWSSD